MSGDLDCYHGGLAWTPGCERHKFFTRFAKEKKQEISHAKQKTFIKKGKMRRDYWKKKSDSYEMS